MTTDLSQEANTPAPEMSPTLDYRVQLDAYAGPLDLLLFLVKRHEIDLHDIPIAELTEQYLKHLELIKEINVDQAGEFLVMAATLLEIKSRMITPTPTPEEGEEGQAAEGGEGEDATLTSGGIDPRSELVQQLLEYKRIKDAAIGLEQRHEDWSSRFTAHAKAGKPEKPEGGTDTAGDTSEGPVEIDLEDVHVLDLCEAFARILETVGHIGDHQVTYDDTPISLHAEDIHDRLKRDGNMTLQQIFVGRTARSEMIGLFLATLELVRQRIIRVVQDKTAGEIQIELRPADEHIIDGIEPDTETNWTDPNTGEPLYDWPSEEAKKRYERRQKRRGKFGPQEKEDEEPVIIDGDDEDDIEDENEEIVDLDDDDDFTNDDED